MNEKAKKTNMIFLRDVHYYAVGNNRKKIKMEFKKGDVINPAELPDKRNLSNHIDMTAKEATVKIDGYSVTRKEAKKKDTATKKEEPKQTEKTDKKPTEKNQTKTK